MSVLADLECELTLAIYGGDEDWEKGGMTMDVGGRSLQDCLLAMSLLLSAGKEMGLECTSWSGEISESLRTEGDADNGEGVLLSVVGETAPEEGEELLRWRLEEELREAIGNAPVSTVEGIWVGAKVSVGINGWPPVMVLRRLLSDVPPVMWIVDLRSDGLFEEEESRRGAVEEGVVGGGGDKDEVASGDRGGEDSSERSEDENSEENENESGEDGRSMREGGSLERTASATDKGEEERSARSAEDGNAGEEEEKEEEDEKDDDEEEGDEKGKDEDEKDGNKKEDRAEEVEDGLQVEIDSAGSRWETWPADDEVVCTMTGSMAVPRTGRGLAGEKGGLVDVDMGGGSLFATKAVPGGGTVTHKRGLAVLVVLLLVLGAALSFLLSASEEERKRTGVKRRVQNAGQNSVVHMLWWQEIARQHRATFQSG